jgi:VIT1/CCC1 family predicted Fe2+/Mn2+ transporter
VWFAKRLDRDQETPRAELEARLLASIRPRYSSHLTQADLARLDDADLAATSARLIRLRQACGCSAGAACLIGALLVGSLMAFRSGATTILEVISLIALVLLGAVVAAVIGKITSIALSKVRWRLESARLIRRLVDSPDGGPHVVLR